MENQLLNLFFIVGIIGFYVYWKMSQNKKRSQQSDFAQEYLKVLNSDEYKVKGKYE